MSATKRITMSNNLAEAFNKLPRKPKAPSGLVTNEWHFDIRYVPLEPNPSHILAIFNPGSFFIHIERLPLHSSVDDDGGIAFFPESGKDAAPEVARALLHSFVDNMGQNKMMGRNAPPAFGPWTLTTEDRELAIAVGQELKRLGVRPPELCKIGVAKLEVVRSMDTEFAKFYKGLTRTCGFTGIAEAALLDCPPCSIVFTYFKPGPEVPPDFHGNSPEDLALEYVQQLSNSSPPAGVDLYSKARVAKLHDGMILFLKTLAEKPEAVIRREADDGSATAALDYGMRLRIGVGCQRSRTLSREYFVKAILSSNASDTIKATAHGVLVRWCTEASSESIRSRYLLMAAHHADQAALLCRRVSPKGVHASPSVLMFQNIFERFAPTVPQLWLLYKNAMRAFEEREKQIQEGRDKMQKKRLEHPLRYRCAAVGCGVEADTGKMLQQCSGKCDLDKKPSYCSKECQKADWKNHKPFCVPGAECSVIDDGFSTKSTPSFKMGTGAIQMPITHADGSTTILSSSTLSPQMLREMRDIAAEGKDLPAAMSNLTIDFQSYDELAEENADP